MVFFSFDVNITYEQLLPSALGHQRMGVARRSHLGSSSAAASGDWSFLMGIWFVDNLILLDKGISV